MVNVCSRWQFLYEKGKLGPAHFAPPHAHLVPPLHPWLTAILLSLVNPTDAMFSHERHLPPQDRTGIAEEYIFRFDFVISSQPDWCYVLATRDTSPLRTARAQPTAASTVSKPNNIYLDSIWFISSHQAAQWNSQQHRRWASRTI